jgi:hypothetical protein
VADADGVAGGGGDALGLAACADPKGKGERHKPGAGVARRTREHAAPLSASSVVIRVGGYASVLRPLLRALSFAVIVQELATHRGRRGGREPSNEGTRTTAVGRHAGEGSRVRARPLSGDVGTRAVREALRCTLAAHMQSYRSVYDPSHPSIYLKVDQPLSPCPDVKIGTNTGATVIRSRMPYRREAATGLKA